MIRWLAYYDLPSVLHPQFLPAQKFMWEKGKNKRNCRVLYLPFGNKDPALQMYFWFICFTNQNPLLYFWIKSNMKYVADLLQENFLHNFHSWNFLAHVYLWKKKQTQNWFKLHNKPKFSWLRYTGRSFVAFSRYFRNTFEKKRWEKQESFIFSEPYISDADLKTS